MVAGSPPAILSPLSLAVNGFVDGATLLDEAEAPLGEQTAQADREGTAVDRVAQLGGETLVELSGHSRRREGLVLAFARDQPGDQLRQGDRTIVRKGTGERRTQRRSPLFR